MGEREATADRDARRLAYRIAAGLCTRCGKVAPREGRRTCVDCGASQAANTATHQRKVRSSGLCYCGRPRVHGMKLCERCHESGRDRAARQFQRRCPEWRTWRGMLERCNPKRAKTPERKIYVERGIAVCERWRDFAAFLADMGPKPTPRHTIDRIDNAKGYEPGNCRWATPTEQRWNSSTVIMVTIGDESAPLAEWSRRRGLNPSTVYGRRARGMSPLRALGVSPDGEP